jgi:hypothetical protein
MADITEQPAAAPAGASADYQKTIRFLPDWVGTRPIFTITAGRPARPARVHLGMGR